MSGHALVELGFGMVDPKVPVTAALVQVILAFEKRAFDVELREDIRLVPKTMTERQVVERRST